MASYLFRSYHAVSLPQDVRPAASDVVDWLERALRTDTVHVERLGAATLEFRSSVKRHDVLKELFTRGPSKPLTLISHGQIDVDPAWDGLRITVRANPRSWLAFLPLVVPLVVAVAVFGWPSVSNVLRWGAGLGGILLGGAVLFQCWGGLTLFIEELAGQVHAELVSPRRAKLPSGAA